MRQAIIIFTRIPVRGKTKTRMMPHLTPEQCAMLHSCFLRDIVRVCESGNAEIFVSYAAGLTSMSFGAFFIATGIGQLPATLVYSYVGGMLTGGAKLFVTGLFILFALSALIVLARNIYMDRQKREQA